VELCSNQIKVQSGTITFVSHFPDENPTYAMQDVVKGMSKAGVFNGVEKPMKSS